MLMLGVALCVLGALGVFMHASEVEAGGLADPVGPVGFADPGGLVGHADLVSLDDSSDSAVLPISLGDYLVAAGTAAPVPEDALIDESEDLNLTDDIGLDFDGEAATDDDGPGISDPFKPINYFFYYINDKLYFWSVKPTLLAYNFIVPEWGRRRVDNVFNNIMSPISFGSHILQLRPRGAATDLGRFLINSTFGLLGLFDVAGTHFGLKSTNEDVGQALGRYGLGGGFYIVLPVLGPSSLRDGIGLVGDAFLNPLNYLGNWKLSLGLHAGEYYNTESLRIGDYEDLKDAAVDPYSALRDAYDQYRREQVRK